MVSWQKVQIDKHCKVATKFSASPGVLSALKFDQQQFFIKYYNNMYPDCAIVSRVDPHASAESIFLNNQVTLHDHLVLNSRHIISSSFNGYAPNSIIQYSTVGQT